MELTMLVGFLAATVRVATPLLLAALGESISERGGVINLGIEGAMLAGALGAALGASAGGAWAGVAAAILAGVVVVGVVAVVSIWAGADQIIAGTAVTLGTVGLTGAVYRHAYGEAGVGLSLPTLPVVPIPGLERIPVLGPALFQQSILTYLALGVAPIVWWALFRTAWGLRLRAAGESIENARVAGVAVGRVRTEGLLCAGGFAGLAGAALVLAQVGTFAENMTAGRGFIAIAIVVLGGWRPGRILGAALLFGAAMALQFLLQSSSLGVPYQFFLMLPYLLTLGVLTGVMRSARPPAALGRN